MRRKTSIYSLWTDSLLSPPFNLFLIFIPPFLLFHLFCDLFSLFLQNLRFFFSPPLIPLTPSYPFIFPSKFTKSCTICEIYLGFLNVSVRFTLLFAKVGDATGSYWVAAVKGGVKIPYLISRTQLTLELCYKHLILPQDSTPSQFVEM